MKALSLRSVWRPLAFWLCILSLTSSRAAGQLLLELSSPKDHCLRDEPLYVVATLRNDGPSECAFLRYLDPASGILSFEIAPPGEEPRACKAWGSLSYTRQGLEQGLLYLGPGEQYRAALEITYEMRDRKRALVLSRPGEYRLRACYSIPETWPAGPLTVWSNELQITVSAPEGIDAAAYETLELGARTHVEGPWNAFSEQAECYEAVLRNSSASAYVVPAAFYLAQVRESDGQEELRGTSGAETAFHAAADLYRAVAEREGETPLGVYATRLAARAFAELGDFARASDLLQQSFLSPAATDWDRLEALSWMGHVESGEFERSGGLNPGSTGAKLSLPLRAFAEVLGFAVQWDGEKGEARMTAPGVEAVLHAGEDQMLVNGAPQGPIASELVSGQPHVSPSAIRILFDAKFGRALADGAADRS